MCSSFKCRGTQYLDGKWVMDAAIIAKTNKEDDMFVNDQHGRAEARNVHQTI